MKHARLPFVILCLSIGFGLVACGDDDPKADTSVKTGMWQYTRVENVTIGPLASATADTIRFSFAICEEDVFETLIQDCEEIDGNRYSWDCTDVVDVPECNIVSESEGYTEVFYDHYEGEETVVKTVIGDLCVEEEGVHTITATFEAVWVRDLEPGDCDMPVKPRLR